MVRTTLTLEDDIARRLTNVAHESQRSLKAVVNEALRRGLDDLARSFEPEFRLQPHAGRLLSGIDDRRLNELAWELDVEPISVLASDRHS